MAGAFVLADQLHDAAIFPDHVMGGDLRFCITHLLERFLARLHAGIMKHQHIDWMLAIIEIGAWIRLNLHSFVPLTFSPRAPLGLARL